MAPRSTALLRVGEPMLLSDRSHRTRARRRVRQNGMTQKGPERQGVMVEKQAVRGEDVAEQRLRARTDAGRYVVTSSSFDFASFRERRRLDRGPGHALDALATELNAEIRQPGEAVVKRIDHVLSRIAGAPEHWALARELVADLRPGDFVYAAGDDVGLPIGLLAAVKRRRSSWRSSIRLQRDCVLVC